MSTVSLNLRKAFFTASAALLVLAPAAALAQSGGSGSLTQDVTGGLTNTGDATGLGSQDVTVTVGNVIKAFLGLLGVIVVVFIIYAGFLWMTAGGNEEQVTKAKDIIKNAVIGMIILMAAYAIASFVISAILTGTGAT